MAHSLDVQLASSYSERNGDALNFRFTASLTGDGMAGVLDMGVGANESLIPDR